MNTQMVTKKALLFDSTMCIGCGACYGACKEKNHLSVTAGNFLQDDLSVETYTVVNRRQHQYIRRLCMHCEEPTCVSVCPVGALVKTEAGPVLYEESKCMGCRYCMQACPFTVPQFEWKNPVSPRISKCNLCHDRIEAGLATACAAVCPTGATKFGSRDELVAEARDRIRKNPEKYYEHIFGLKEVGGTSVLMLAAVPLEQLGYPTGLLKQPLPPLTREVLHKLPGVVGIGGVLMCGVWWITNRRNQVQRAAREEKLRAQTGAESNEGSTKDA